MFISLSSLASIGVLSLAALTPAFAAAPPKAAGAHSPTVVLVHGAFADSAGWNGVIERLRAAGVPVMAVSNPLRGLTLDSDYVASALRQVPGPVIAVGHSYGGAVITNAASHADNVVALVYVAAFAPDAGESLGAIEKGSKDSVLNSAIMVRKYPTGANAAADELYIDPAKFHDAFAADLPPATTALMALTQRPIAAHAFDDVSGVPAWKKLPSWAVIATGDKAAGSDVVRWMAKRAKANSVEVPGSHVIMISRPREVADVIMKAVKSVRAGAAKSK